MTKLLIKESVDIEEYPGQPCLNNFSQRTIGDLHANALKLIYFLAHEGIISLSAGHYQRLVEIYKTPVEELNQNIINEFDAIISGLEVINNQIFCRLLGDETADRGSNDYFILKVLEKLALENVPYEIILSNHGIGFIHSYESGFRFKGHMLYHEQSCSIDNLQNLINRKLISEEDVKKLIDTAYKPALKALSYSINKRKNTLTLFSHAPIDLQIVRYLSENLDIEYNDDSLDLLAETIDEINHTFQVLGEVNLVSYTYHTSTQIEQNKSINPWNLLTWNRNYDILTRLPHHKSYQLNFVHGHDADGPTNHYCYNLDNFLGKGCLEKFHHIDEYSIFATNDLSPKSKNFQKISEIESIETEEFSDLDSLLSSCEDNTPVEIVENENKDSPVFNAYPQENPKLFLSTHSFFSKKSSIQDQKVTKELDRLLSNDQVHGT